MSTTVFVNGVTLTDAGWFNDVDMITYDGLTTQVLVGGGAGVAGVWTTATGSGAPVRATSPTIASATLTGTLLNGWTLTPATITLTGTTGQTYTLPTTTATLARTDAGQTFTGTNVFGALTLGGTVSGGGNQINNIIIGTTTPLAGAFTTLASGNQTITSAAGVPLTIAVPATNDTKVIDVTGATTGAVYIQLVNSVNSAYFGVDKHAGNFLVTGGGADEFIIKSANAINFSANNGTSVQMKLATTGSLVWGTGVANFGKVTKRKTADETVTNSTTLQDDDHLTFPIAANEEWVGVIEYTFTGSTISTSGFKVAITFPAGATVRYSNIPGTNSGNNTTTTSGSSMGVTGALADPVPFGWTMTRLTFWVLNGATPGNVTAQFAQNTGSATGLVAVKGSFLNATRVA